MIPLTPQPEHHTEPHDQSTCARCAWAVRYYNLAHHIRTRQELQP